MPANLEFSESVHRKIDEHSKLLESTYDIGLRLMSSRNGDIFTFDVLVMAALKRSAALQSGFREMILARNMICAGAILRLQLDTSLRMYGAWLVEDADEFASRILHGEKINAIRSGSGEKLTDRFLVESLAKEYPWVTALYEVCCDYVHFSSLHMWASSDGVDRENAVARVKISHVDRDLPDEYYVGSLVDSMSCTKILHELVEARIDQRQMV